jgi:hypothetical protein
MGGDGAVIWRVGRVVYSEKRMEFVIGFFEMRPDYWVESFR